MVKLMLSQDLAWQPDGRAQLLGQLKSGATQWDMIVVGGGITGAGIYREAARLGLNVLLLEQRDFAWGTSSRSSKMVHGGLRYLGSGQLSLANDSVKERQNLLTELPGLVNPLPFVMGHYKGVFPGPWIFNKLLAVYDFMAGQRYRQYFNKGIRDFLVPGMNTCNLKGATQFSDAVTDDARLVMRVLHDGNADGGTAVNYVKAVDTLKSAGLEEGGADKVTGLTVEDQVSGEQFEVRAKVVINATGTWTDELRRTLGQKNVIRPLRGSHLVVPFWRLPSAFSVSFFHAQDKRPVFVFPWEGVTVIGTTDLDHQQNSGEEASITQVEVDYLLAAANAQFPEAKLLAKDIRATWSGVRPVVSKQQDKAADASQPNKPSDEKREHAVWDDQGLISVAGGKLTTYRLIALDVLQKAAPYLPALSTALQQGEREENRVSHFKPAFLASNFIQLSAESKKRLLGRYGHHTQTLLSHAQSLENEYKKVGSTDTLWAELSWSCQHEAIQHLDDLLLRRTRIGLLLANGAEAELPRIKVMCQKYLVWDDVKWAAELKRYQGIIEKHYSLPKRE